ncbi:MAG: hypothetical protein WBX11_00070 [Thiobacillaceae bacterium]
MSSHFSTLPIQAGIVALPPPEIPDPTRIYLEVCLHEPDRHRLMPGDSARKREAATGRNP